MEWAFLSHFGPQHLATTLVTFSINESLYTMTSKVFIKCIDIDSTSNKVIGYIYIYILVRVARVAPLFY